jgi:transposase
MSGVPKIEIAESVSSLKSLMKQQKTGLRYAKVQALYLLKIKAVETVNHLAIILGRGESTVHSWLHSYRTGGLSKLLEEPPKTGRPKKLEIDTVSQLQRELSDREGFNSYQEVHQWVCICLGIAVSYQTIHRVVRYELQSKLKVARPYHEKQQPGIIAAFKQHFSVRLQGLLSDIIQKYGQNCRVNYWFQDETRLGLRTPSTRKITRKGVKPQQLWQWHYQYYYIYGLVAPVTGKSFFYEFSHFNSQCLSIFLDKFAQEYPDEVHIIQLDNAPCHTTDKLILPDNVVLLFQPPYCPELNAIERLWQYLKQKIKNFWFTALEEVKEKVAVVLNDISSDVIRSLTGWKYVLDALSL